MFDPKQPIFESKAYLLETNSVFGHKTFQRYAEQVYNIEIVSAKQASNILCRGGRILANGYGTQVQSLVKAHPNQVFPIWHSTVVGALFMEERGILEAALKDSSRGIVSILMLSDFDDLPKNWYRIKQFIPRKIDMSFYEPESNEPQMDIVLPTGGEQSRRLKNIGKLLYDCACFNVSIAMQKGVESLSFDLLKTAFDSPNLDIRLLDKTNPLKAQYFRSSKLYVCPSVTDTMPYTVLESILAGVPVLVSPNVGWAHVFKDISHMCVFEVQDIVPNAKMLSKNKLAREALYYKQVEAINKYAEIWFNFNNRLLYPQQVAFEPTTLVGLASIKQETVDHIMYSVDTKDQTHNIVQSLKNIVNSAYGLKSLEIKVFCTDQQEMHFELCVVQSKSTYEHAIDLEPIKSILNQSNINDCPTNLIYKIISATNITLNLTDIKTFLESKTLLVVDRFGWAFHNISKQIAKTRSDVLITTEAQVLAFASQKQKLKVEASVYFWFPTQQKVKSTVFSKNTAICVYDHYSYNTHKTLFERCLEDANHIYVANEVIRHDLKKAFAQINAKQIFTLKDGVDLNKFKGEKAPRSKFVVGWIGKGTKDVWDSSLDAKGIRFVNELEQRFRDHESISIHVHDIQTKELIPHDEIFAKFYAHVDCLLCTSTLEGTPNPVFEAWASGLFVLSTRVGNVSDLMLEGVNGFFIERDIEQIVLMIEKASCLKVNEATIKSSVSSFDWSVRVLSWNYALDLLNQDSLSKRKVDYLR